MDDLTNVARGESQAPSLNAVFTALASRERRRIAGLVAEGAPEPVPRDELVAALGATTSDQRRQAAIELHHKHLPTLTDAGLVEHDSDAETVALGDHPALEDPEIREVLEDDVAASPESLDALFGALADGRRRRILDVLSHQFGHIHVETLAQELETYDDDRAESDVPAEDVDGVMTSLYHLDLPHLADADLVEFDSDDGTVAYAGHPQLRVPWMHSVFHSEFRRSLTGESDPSGIGELEGREEVISFGQSLCDRADEELFCMFTDTDLLEAGCLTRIRDASRRGATVYLGTRDPVIRDYVRENAPEVVLWEPNTDWLNLPVAGDRVGRLLLADREAVMLGTLLEEKTDGLHQEQAIVGEGEHNTLVTMICQLLAPHLETIDSDTEDIEAQLPV